MFKPEFLNRIDETILFHRLTKQDVCQIASQLLFRLRGRLSELNIGITFSQDAVTQLAQLGYDPAYGARPLRRVIRSRVEDPLAEQILSHQLVPGDSVELRYLGEEKGFTFLKG